MIHLINMQSKSLEGGKSCNGSNESLIVSVSCIDLAQYVNENFVLKYYVCMTDVMRFLKALMRLSPDNF